MAESGLESTEEWRAIGRGPDLLYEIIAWPEKKGVWAEDEFYSMGRSDWEDFRRHWLHYWPDLGGACVEVGCGVGRITHVLAKEFDHVIALDVAAEMLSRAKAVVPENVEFHQVEGTTIPAKDASADGVFSVHVLQHLDNLARVADYLAEMRRVLKPGGTLMVHINMVGRSGRSLGLRGWALHKVARLRNLRAIRSGRTHSYVTMNFYRMEDLWPLLVDLGFADIELRVFPVRSNGYPHSFWFARRPSEDC